jgi:RNA polymerase sigma-70 factor (ECF subfamily)
MFDILTTRFFSFSCHICAAVGGILPEAAMSTPDEDSTQTRELLGRIKAGDAPAFEALFARHRSALLAFIDTRLDDRIRARVDPSDVVQETQLDAFRRLQDYLDREPMPFRLWLRKTAYERLLKVQRHHAAAQRSVERESALPDRSSLLLTRSLLDRGSSPSKQMSRREIARHVRESLNELGETDREILLMRNVEELPYEEIACLLDLSPAAARKRYGRALLRLQKILSDAGLLEPTS